MIIRNLLLLFITCCTIGCSSGFLRPAEARQAFFKLFGGSGEQSGMDLVLAEEGEMILLGSTASTKHPDSISTGSDMYFVQTDAYGDGLLSKRFGQSLTSEDRGISITPQADGFLLLGETTTSLGQTDLWLIRVTAEGDLLWELVLGTPDTDEWAGEVILDAEDGIMVVGTTTNVNRNKHETDSLPATDQTDIYLARISTSGELLWERILGFTGEERGTSLTSLPDGGIAVLGETDFNGSDNGNRDLLLFLTDESGIPIQSQRFGQVGEDEHAKQVLLTQNEQLILMGNVGTGINSRPFLVSISDLDSPGSDWEQRVDFPCTAEGIAETEEGGFILSATEELPESGDENFLLLRLELDGSLRWSQSFGSAGQSIAGQVLALPDSGYVFVGTHDFGSNTMMSLIKTDPEGQLNP